MRRNRTRGSLRDDATDGSDPGADFGSITRDLALDGAAEDAFDVLEAVGIMPVLLKGASVARTLYFPHQRPYHDVDLLVGPADLDNAIVALARVGFALRHPNASIAETGVYARELVRGPALLDIHIAFPGIEAAPAAAWLVLRQHLDHLWLRTRDVTVLDETARGVIAALHAARPVPGMATEDLRRMVALYDDSKWDEIIGLAGQLHALPSFAVGLCRVEPAHAIVEAHDLRRLVTRDALMASSGVPTATGLQRLARARGRERLRLIARELVPTPDGVRYWRPQAAESRKHLLIAYAIRPIYLLRSLIGVWGLRRNSSREIARLRSGTEADGGRGAQTGRNRGRGR